MLSGGSFVKICLVFANEFHEPALALCDYHDYCTVWLLLASGCSDTLVVILTAQNEETTWQPQATEALVREEKGPQACKLIYWQRLVHWHLHNLVQFHRNVVSINWHSELCSYIVIGECNPTGEVTVWSSRWHNPSAAILLTIKSNQIKYIYCRLISKYYIDNQVSWEKYKNRIYINNIHTIVTLGRRFIFSF
jgi:hypothetical protein